MTSGAHPQFASHMQAVKGSNGFRYRVKCPESGKTIRLDPGKEELMFKKAFLEKLQAAKGQWIAVTADDEQNATDPVGVSEVGDNVCCCLRLFILFVYFVCLFCLFILFVHFFFLSTRHHSAGNGNARQVRGGDWGEASEYGLPPQQQEAQGC